MPLIQSSSRDAIGTNIREMIGAGHPRRQAIAAALRTADQYGKRRAAGGATPTQTANSASDVPFITEGLRQLEAAANRPYAASAAASGPPTAPRYGIGATGALATGVLSNGLMPVPQTGTHTFDPFTGALSGDTQKLLSSFAMRGLPPPSAAPGYPTAPAPAPAPTNPGDPGFDFQASIGGGNARGGKVRKFAAGGTPSLSAPWFERSEAHAMDHPAGLVHTAGPGRTDTVPLSVAAGSHVIPADVVAGLGQGNTLAGAHSLGVAMSTGPGGIKMPSGTPRAQPAFRMHRLARGGPAEFEGNAIKVARGHVPEEHGGVKCIVAGGEWIMKPDEVRRVRHAGKAGHEAVDAWILERRGADVRKLKSLPGPVK